MRRYSENRLFSERYQQFVDYLTILASKHVFPNFIGEKYWRSPQVMQKEGAKSDHSDSSKLTRDNTMKDPVKILCVIAPLREIKSLVFG